MAIKNHSNGNLPFLAVGSPLSQLLLYLKTSQTKHAYEYWILDQESGCRQVTQTAHVSTGTTLWSVGHSLGQGHDYHILLLLLVPGSDRHQLYVIILLMFCNVLLYIRPTNFGQGHD